MKTSKEWEEIFNKLSKLSLESIERASESFMMLGKSAKAATTELNKLGEVLELGDKVIGNKRNGTQDRQQAFGGLF
ncbi:hypothetical protein [uncultured Vagococcus sp.]|uniref:hypothetical protein n=1 Tax=uncultured Vagococcus sp. TaxID=189676 RepID=UPI002583B3FA|nr:hypothetical protein [uncultured Vagococcus sp.]